MTVAQGKPPPMLRLFTLRSAAALFALSGALSLSVQAQAGEIGANEASYAAVLRGLNPQLPAARARAYARSVMADAWRTHLDPRFIMSIVTVESRWRSNAVSRVGARGLGQLMPGTAATLGVNPFDASENLRGTSRYLSSLMNHFAGQPNATALAIAGYNAGPKAVERYHGIPPYAETQNYVVKVLAVWKELRTRIGRALAPHAGAPSSPTPDELQWVSRVDSAAPQGAPALALPARAAVPLELDGPADPETPAIPAPVVVPGAAGNR
jgi:soluble lytic murein transglycosylase-like protein